MASLQQFLFPGIMLQRGFWLCVWQIEIARGGRRLYVGRTGDNWLAKAKFPFTRLRQHLDIDKHASVLRRQIRQAGIETVSGRFEMTASGPLSTVESCLSKEYHL